MLALRLVRGSGPLALLPRLLVASAAAGVGLLLLNVLGYALEHPAHPDAALARLLWSLVPFAAAVQLAVAVARTDPATRPRSGLDAAGAGPARLPLIAAAMTAVFCLLGSAVALLVFLQLRGGPGWLPPFGTGPGAGGRAGGPPLPPGAVLVLLTALPAAAAATGVLALRIRRSEWAGSLGAARRSDAAHRGAAPAGSAPASRTGWPSSSADAPREDESRSRVPVPGGLPWGAALVAAGLAIGAYASHGALVLPRSHELRVPLPGTLEPAGPGVVSGWLLAAAGLVTAGPGLVHACGRLIAGGRPGALRLLSGRLLQSDARRIGHPLGSLWAAAVAALAAAGLVADSVRSGQPEPFGPLTWLGLSLVVGCSAASLLAAAAEARSARHDSITALLGLGASAALLRGAAALRAVVLLAALAPPTWLIAELATLPLA